MLPSLGLISEIADLEKQLAAGSSNGVENATIMVGSRGFDQRAFDHCAFYFNRMPSKCAAHEEECTQRHTPGGQLQPC